MAKVEAVESAEQSSENWPMEDVRYNEFERMTALQFKRDFIDIMPPSWTTISLNLDKGQNHLLVTRYISGTTPLILRLPLERQNSDETESHTFSFKEAQNELLSIIAASDDTISRGKEEPATSKARGAKTQWWIEREELDERMHRLLLNIEAVWFGGFRGILSSQAPRADRPLRFRKSFDAILDKHMPSRRKYHGSAAAGQVALDMGIYELFVNLSSP